MAPATPGSDVLCRMVRDLEAGRDPFVEEDAAALAGADGGLPEGLRPLRPGVTYVGPLPRQTGALRPDHLGRDELGPVLIGGDQRRVDGAP